MPELPEVQTVVDTLSPLLVGRRIKAIVHLRADIVTPSDVNLSALLTGRRVISIARRAKRIVFHLDDDSRWFIHLGMTGRLTMERANAPTLKHTHMVLDCGAGRQLRFVDPRRFGGVFWLGSDDREESLGPEPLALRAAEFVRRLRNTRRSIKAALLDQKFIAGIGNIYADEALFEARIHPLAMTDRIMPQEARRLNQSIKRVLKRAIKHRGSSFRDYVDANGQRGSFHKLHRVYDRAGEKCVRCGTTIERIIVAQRSTCFCPRCQGAPSS
jgi:formamidopyrimidine-DNA glycosylase